MFFKTGYSYFKQVFNIGGKATIFTGTTVTNDSTCNTSITNAVTYWTNGSTKSYTYTFNLTNLSNAPYYGWNISVPVPSDATISTVNCNYKIQNSRLHLSNMSYNSYLNSGASVNFSATITTNQSYALSNINVYNCENESNISNDVTLKVNFVKTGSWSGYEQYDVVIINDSTKSIKAWKLVVEFNSSLSVASSWNTNFSRTSNTVTFTNMAHNGTIAPSKSTSFGMQIKSTSNNFTMT
jgi:hypothetical protein